MKTVRRADTQPVQTEASVCMRWWHQMVEHDANREPTAA